MNRAHLKLGCLPFVPDARDLMLARYDRGLPPAPSAIEWAGLVQPHMYANDTLGDCTCAAYAHMVQDWTASSHTEIDPTDTDVIEMYDSINGGADRGATCRAALNHARRVGCAGHKIGAFAHVPRSHVHQAIYLFGGAYVGLDLPLSAQDQAVWDVPAGGPVGDGAPRSWGGHAINLRGYRPGRFIGDSWGAEIQMTEAFLTTYAPEIYALLSADFLYGGRAPNGFDLSTLLKDLVAVTR